MVIDTSAVVAILLGEPDAEPLARAIADDPRRLMAAFTELECAVVLGAKRGEIAVRDFDLFMHRADIRQVHMDGEQIARARQAYELYGKGRHAAGLNLGDCCAYALSHVSSEPLLFKGEDFQRTDVRAASY